MTVGDVFFIFGYWLFATIILTAGWWRWEAVALRRARPLVALLPTLVAALDWVEDAILLYILRTDAISPYFADGMEIWSFLLFLVAWTKWIAIVVLAIAVALAVAIWIERRDDPYPEITGPDNAAVPSEQQQRRDAIRKDPRYQAYDPVEERDDDELEWLKANPQGENIVGICLSGGGIRSTAFCLGVLAELEKPLWPQATPPYRHEYSVTDSARYLTAVSGGSWAATAWTLQKARDRKNDLYRLAPSAQTVFTGLRNGTGVTGFQRQKYLLNGAGSITGGIAWALLCSLTNIVLIGLIVFVVAWPLGMLMGTASIAPRLRMHPHDKLADIDTWPLIWPSIVYAVLGVLVVLCVGSFSKAIAQHWAIGVGLFGLAAFSAAYLLVLPTVFAYAASDVGLAGALKQAGEVIARSAIASSLVVSVGTAVWRVVSGPIMREVSSTTMRLLPKLFGLVLAAGIVGWGVIVMYGAARYESYARWPTFVWALLVLIALFLLLSPNWPTLHNIFSKRLARSFDPVSNPMVDGSRVQAKAPMSLPQRLKRAATIAWSKAVRLCKGGKTGNTLATWSGLAAASRPGNQAVPELVLCCSQQRDGITTGGLRADSFTVSPHWVRQGKRSIDRSQYTEAAAAVRRCVPRLRQHTEYDKVDYVASWMATSGAAMSSAMGRHSVGTSNAMLAAVNADLGIWLPNLAVVQDKWRSSSASGSSTQPTTNSRVQPMAGSGGARKTPVSEVDERRKDWRKLLPRLRFDYTIKELLGWYNAQDRFVFITDGGHWENLGLVELLRRGCTTILCVDASGDPPGSFAALREALNLESLELGKLKNIDRLNNSSKSLCRRPTTCQPA
jgi:hypothetical protein